MQIQKNIDISPLVWYRLGGTVDYLLTCHNKEDVLEALNYIQQNKTQKFLTIGQGSNLIFAIDHFKGAIIRIVGRNNSFEINDSTISCFGGEVLDDLIMHAFQNNLIGLEWAGGLPGTVGAGIRGNVGAFGGEIKDTCISAEVARIEQEKVNVLDISNQEMNFTYRESKIKDEKSTIVLTARFQLQKASDEQLQKAKETYEKNKEYRKNRHPIEFPNCGSVFKNIVKKEEVDAVFGKWPDVKDKAMSDWYGKVSMGYIIDRLGFTGKKVGGALVSEKHSNFIINTGGATGADVLQLIIQIQQSVQNEFGFKPEVEPEIIK